MHSLWAGGGHSAGWARWSAGWAGAWGAWVGARAAVPSGRGEEARTSGWEGAEGRSPGGPASRAAPAAARAWGAWGALGRAWAAWPAGEVAGEGPAEGLGSAVLGPCWTVRASGGSKTESPGLSLVSS